MPDGVFIKHADKICTRIRYQQSDFCAGRFPNETLQLRFYDQPKESDAKTFFGTFVLPNQQLSYNNSEWQEMCVTCDQFDATAQFTGGTCAGAMEQFGKLVAKSGPKVELQTANEFTVLDRAITFEITGAFWPAGIAFAGVLIVITVSVIALHVKSK